MAKHLSIKGRLEKARRPEQRAAVVRDWAESWEAEQRAALRVNDCGRLQEITNRRFTGLRTVLEALLAAGSDEPMPIRISNDGADITSTDYWDSAPAKRGLCYLSGNADTWRLLVPPSAEEMIPEMRTGTSATIEPSMQITGHWDIVFEDGSDSPYALAIDSKLIDRAVTPGASTLVVWTTAGRQLSLPCAARI